MEERKFEAVDARFHASIEEIIALGFSPRDYIHHFPCFTGHVNLGRYLFLYERYRQTLGLCGHVADVGSWKGASLLFFAKLARLFENNCQTQVHGFDWFQGMAPEKGVDNEAYAGSYAADHATLAELIRLQELDDTAFIHKLDLTKDLPAFFADKRQMRFKLVFLDCGAKAVLEAALAHFWPRLVTGGVLILDHFNNACSPFESETVQAVIGGRPVMQAPFARQPSAYVVKEASP